VPYPPEFELVYNNTNSATFVEILSVIGSGYVKRIGIASIGGEGEIRITIDGYVRTVTMIADTDWVVGANLDASSAIMIERDEYTQASAFEAWFRDELKIEIRKTTGTTMHAKIIYGVI